MNASLRVDLAAVVDVGECLVKTIYKLEGNGLLSLVAYELVNTILASTHVAHYPNVNAVAKQLRPGNTVAQQQWAAYALDCVRPGFWLPCTRFWHYFEGCGHSILRYETIQYSESARNSAISIFTRFTDCYHFRWVCTFRPQGWATHISKSMDVNSTVCPIQWWKTNASELPLWSSAARKVLVLQPSSASSEQVFSRLSNYFSGRQGGSLDDFVEASLMPQYKNRWLTFFCPSICRCCWIYLVIIIENNRY